MKNLFKSTFVVLLLSGSLCALDQVGKGAFTGGFLGTVVGGMADGKRGAGIGATVGLGAGLLGGSVAKSDRKRREREDAQAAAAYYSHPSRRIRYNPQDEINALAQENESLYEQMNKMQRIISTKDQKIVSLDAQVEALQIQNQELREDLRSQKKQFQSDMLELRNSNKEFQKELSKLKSEITKLKKGLKKKVVVIEEEDDNDETKVTPVLVRKTTRSSISK